MHSPPPVQTSPTPPEQHAAGAETDPGGIPAGQGPAHPQKTPAVRAGDQLPSPVPPSAVVPQPQHRPAEAQAASVAFEPTAKSWRKRHIAQRRAILPIDLKMRPAIAAIFGALMTMILTPAVPRQTALDHMFARILAAEIYEKPGRTYPRRKKRGKGKGNLKAQYQRRKQRKAAKKTKPG